MRESLWRRVRAGLKTQVMSERSPLAATLHQVAAISDAALESMAKARGYDLVRKHYYSPIPSEDDCAANGFWDSRTDLPGLDMGEAAGRDLMANVFPSYLAEFRSQYAIREQDANGRFHLINGVYMAVDAHVYYSLVRHLKPKRIIEIGSGQSTRLALDAMALNAKEGATGKITAVEPYPSDQLKQLAAEGPLDLVQAKVQDLGLGLFESLQSGDILFIDSTHVLREGNDVQFEYLELLPRLADGVYVHVHDISLPRRYPKCYFEQGLYWNEQYLLQAFLAFNSKFEVIWAGNHLLLKYPEVVQATFPEIAIMREKWPLSEPSAFWMRTRKSR